MDNMRVLGRTGMKVFSLGFGGIPIQRLTTPDAIKVVQKAVDLGINFIDTARAYTDSEEKIGEALKGISANVFLATKTQARDKKGAKEDVDKSLQNLGVDTIDLYQLHAVNDDKNLEQVMGEKGALEGLKEAQTEGKIRYIGVTGHSTDILMKALKTNKFDTVQFCYNFIETDCEKELIDYARSRNIGMIGMKPLAGGRFDNAVVSLKYVLNQPAVVPIPGMETIREVEENIKIARGSWEINTDEKKYIDKMREELGEVFCRRCGYCLPCPQDIKIPQVLRAESFIKRMPAESLKKGWVKDAFEKAESCIECNECIKKCPYNLPIPRLIKENIGIMKDFYSSI